MDLWLDIRYAVRTLLRAPGFTTVAAITFALGVGANTAIFSVVESVLLRPPAGVVEPERVVYLFTSDYSGPAYGSSSYPDVEEMARATDVFAAVSAFGVTAVTLETGEAPVRVRAELVEPAYFEALGVRPLLGRLFQPAEGEPGGPPIAVLSADLWRTRFGGDAGAIGRTMRIDDIPFTIAGVAADGFAGTDRGSTTQVWIPLRGTGSPAASDLAVRDSRGLSVVARLADGVSRERAQEQMDALAATLHATYPAAWTDVRGAGRRVTVLHEAETRVPPNDRGEINSFVALLLVVVGLLLLLCCANVASLLLARATGRRREIAIRVAIGAGRRRLMRQLLAESLVLALIGGGLGVLMAAWATDLLPRLLATGTSYSFTPDATVLGYALLVTVACGVLFGLAPVLQAVRSEVVGALRGEAPPLDGRRRWNLRDALVVLQVAISIVLLIGAGLFLRSLQEANRIDPGFDAANVLVMGYELPGRDVTDAQRRAFEDALAERVAALPGARGVAYAERVPIAQPYGRRSVRVDGYAPAPGEEMEFPFNVVGAGYFEILRVPLVRGRGFTEVDRAGAPPAIVVNESFARRFWPDQDPLGRRVIVGRVEREVVGVARDGKYWSLGEAPRPYYYLPRLQEMAHPTLHVRVDADPMALATAVREAARAIEPNVVVLDVRPMQDAIAASMMPQRTAGTLLSFFGGLALALACAGLYGVMAYVVGRRMAEFGLRIALGARSRDVLRLVLGRALALTAAGTVLGMIVAFLAARLAGSLLFGVSPTDARTFLATLTLLSAVAVLASWLPAWRATRSDPMRSLRTE
jgi:predicted permease